MSTIKHLKRAVQILKDNFENDIQKEGDFTWNMKGWTIQFLVEPYYESVVAYKVKGNLTQWSEYITLEAKRMEWRTLV